MTAYAVEVRPGEGARVLFGPFRTLSRAETFARRAGAGEGVTAAVVELRDPYVRELQAAGLESPRPRPAAAPAPPPVAASRRRRR